MPAYIGIKTCTHAGSTEGSRRMTHYYEFIEDNPLTIRIQISLLQIRGLDLRALSENKKLKYVLLHNGDILFDTSNTPFTGFSEANIRFTTSYSINNDNAAEVTVTFDSPPLSAEGTYEYQFYVNTDIIQQHLNESRCSEQYLNFVQSGHVRLNRILIGTTTFNIKMEGK